MDESPRKRRKTSSPAQAPSSPLRRPPRRPSFASPTKASLARNYPNLLPTRTLPRDDTRAREPRPRAAGMDRTPPEEREHKDDDEADLPTTPSQRGLEEQEGPRRGMLFSSPSRRPPRVPSVVKRSPLARAPAVQQDQLTRSEGQVLDTENHEKSREIGNLPLDSEIEKKRQEKARLQREVEELEAQVSACTNEIVAEQQRGQEEALPPTQRVDLLKFITKISGVDTQDEPRASISNLLCSFLPFSGRVITPPKQKRPEQIISSHRPLDLQDPLPYLKMFTSFNFSTQIDLPQSRVLPSSKRVHQKHTIDISGPQKLLTVQLAIKIDCLSDKAVDMQILRLPSWAERELGTFMRAKADEQDLGNACWAVDSFWDIATKRAACWHRCEKAFTHLLPGQVAADAENAPVLSTKASALSRKELSRHLGRDVFILQDKHVLFKINWQIVFDWTGEAESNVHVECAVPAVWTEADTSDIFRKIPETFDALLRTKGVFEATRIMVALLFSQ